MSRFKAAVAAALFLGAVPEVRGSVIVFDESWPTGTDNTIVEGVSFTSSPGNFAVKLVAGVYGVGVAGGAHEEIEVGDSITAVFPAASKVDHLVLAFLFNGPEFFDYAEIASVLVNGSDVFTLSSDALADNLAVWSGPGGVVSNLSPATLGSAALWKIANPFGDTLVTSLVFTAQTSAVCGTPPCFDQSDYSLREMQFEPVPEPATLLLLGAGLAGIGARRRRRA